MEGNTEQLYVMCSSGHWMEQQIPEWIDLKGCGAILWWAPRYVSTPARVNDTAALAGSAFIIFILQHALIGTFISLSVLSRRFTAEVIYGFVLNLIEGRVAQIWPVSVVTGEEQVASPQSRGLGSHFPDQLKPPVCLIFSGRKWRWHTYPHFCWLKADHFFCLPAGRGSCVRWRCGHEV